MIDAREKEHDMEEVRDAIARTIEYHHGNEPISSSPMQEAAEKWAVHSLRTYKGALLTRALAVSEALSAFVTELEHPPAE